ncbi:MAG: helix-turn-helix domain-containing protein [Bermanella sp.]
MAVALLFINCTSKVWLSAFMAFFAGYLGLIILDAQDFFISPQLYFLLLPIIFLPGPILLGYVGNISTRQVISVRDFLMTLIPILFVVFTPSLLSNLGTFELASAQDYQKAHYVTIFNLVSALAGLQMLVYLGLSVRLISQMRRDWTSYQSKTLPSSWYKMLQVFGVIAITLITQVSSAFMNPAGASVSLGDLGFIFMVLYFIGVSVQTVWENRQVIHSSTVANTAQVKNTLAGSIQDDISPADEIITCHNTQENGSHSASVEEKALANLLAEKLNSQQLYLQEDLSLLVLANHLQVSTHKLSAVINTVFKQNFYEYINDFRVRYAAQELLINPQRNITEIFFEAGFTTKSTFYSYFKKAFGCTPGQYRKQQIPKE